MKRRSRANSKTNQNSLTFESLEKRELMAVAFFEWQNDKLIIHADHQSTNVELVVSNSDHRVVDKSTSSHRIWDWANGRKINSANVIEFRGGNGNDTFRNYILTKPIRAFGNGGNDVLHGGDRDDVLQGGDGDDSLYGHAGRDVLRGDQGNDYLNGGSNNDRLIAGGGRDQLFGGGSRDGLIGDGDDELFGQEGQDRFLVLPGTNAIRDRTPSDVAMIMRNGSSNWSWQELEIMDQAFAELHSAADGTRLLKDTTSTRDLIFQKEAVNNQFLGRNTETKHYESYWDIWSLRWKNRLVRTDRLIQIADFNENNATEVNRAKDTLIHEVGHNWDSALERSNRGVNGATWTAFMDIGKWRSTQSPGFSRSGDGNWFFRSDRSNGFWGGAVFSQTLGQTVAYGKWNPLEDFATSFEAFFRVLRQNGMSSVLSDSNRHQFAQARLNSVNSLIWSVRGLG